MTYEAFRGSGLDLSAVGFMPGGEAYFCTPVGAKILGRAGVDGIHFCTAPETGDMILAVSPANGAEDCIHPVARDFPDFLRLLLACGDTAALEQSWMWSEEQFVAFLRENPPTPEGETALAALRDQGATPMEEPYRYLHALQAGFDPGVLCYSQEYRELQQETEERPWRVSFHGGLIGHGGRAGKAIPADTWFTWEGETWYVPALYRCPEGIVVDLFQRVDVETMWAYCGKWKLTPETDWDAMPEERRCQAQAEHPFCQDFRAMLAVNGRGLRQRHGCSSVWLPLWPDREDRDMRAALQHYGLDTGDCWQLHRLSFEWTGEKPRKGKDFALILSGEETDVPGPSFQAERVGETVTFRHPVTGAEHTLTVRSIEPRDYDRPEDPGWEYPRYFTALGYTVEPDIPQEAFSVRDCAPADPARRKPAAPKDQLGGGTALFFIGRDEEGRRWAASSMHFAPPERVTWRVHFHIVSRGEVTVELPGEP